MAEFQLLECNVALAGDILNVVHRGPWNPITYPELFVLRAIHGENAITEVYACGAVEREEAAEKARLCDIYSRPLIEEKLFPGAAIRLPLNDPRYQPRLANIPKISAEPLPAAPDLPDPLAPPVPPPGGIAFPVADGAGPLPPKSKG